MFKDVLDDPTLGLILHMSQAELILDILTLANSPYVTFFLNTDSERDRFRKTVSDRHEEIAEIIHILERKVASPKSHA